MYPRTDRYFNGMPFQLHIYFWTHVMKYSYFISVCANHSEGDGSAICLWILTFEDLLSPCRLIVARGQNLRDVIAQNAVGVKSF